MFDKYCVRTPVDSRQTAAVVRERIEQAGERVWRFDDFRDLPLAAVAQALSRLKRDGTLQRLSKGTYFRSRKTPFGTSRPNPAALQRAAAQHSTMFPSGLAAANLLGFTTQTGRTSEYATSALSLPRKLVGQDAIVHARRPAAWAGLSSEDAAFLDFLRVRGTTTELSAEATVKRLLKLMATPGRFERLLRVAGTEPPRVRAMLGAIGSALHRPVTELQPLRQSLNPLSRFDFGHLNALPHATHWQAKGARR